MPAHCIIIPPSRNLIDELVERLDLSSTDLRRSLIVFPGKRPAHFLRKAIAQRLGKSFLPPHIFSYDTFIEFLATEKLGLKSALLQPLDAAALLFEIHTGSGEQLGRHFPSFDRFVGLGLKLFDEMEELQLSDIPQQRLEEAIGSLTFGRLHALTSYYGEFYRRVVEQGRITRSLQLRAVAERFGEIDFSVHDRIILAGFYALRQVDQRIFRALAGMENVTLVFQQGPRLLQHLQQIGIEKEELHDQGTRPTMSFCASPDAHGQILALAHEVKRLIDEGIVLDERTVIVVPSPDALFPVIHHVLPLLPQDGHNISLGYPLNRTPLYSFLSGLLRVLSSSDGDRLLASAYVEFMLHPYTKNIRFDSRTDVTRTMVHAIEEWIASRSGTMISLQEIEQNDALFERVSGLLRDTDPSVAVEQCRAHLIKIHDSTIRALSTVGSVGEFASRLIDLIVFISSASTANLHPLFHRSAESMLERLDAMRTSLAARESFADMVGYASLFRSYVGKESVPFPGTPLRGVQVLGLLETRNLSFDRVFVLDVSDDVIPGARGSEMLLPQGLRERLGLETYRDREKLIEYYFHLLISGAREVHFFFAENDRRERSRFIQKILWQQQRQEEVSGVRNVRYRVTLRAHNPQPIAKDESALSFLKTFHYSTSSLDMYLACPLRFYYRYVLKLEEREEVATGIELMEAGTLVHRSLSEFFKPLVGKRVMPDALNGERMERAVESVFARTFGTDLKGRTYLLKQQITVHLKDFLESYVRRVVSETPVELLDVEKEISIVNEGYTLSGRIDCLERRGDSVYIIDYKISDNDSRYKIKWKKFDPQRRDSWPDSICSLQLPMYSMLYSRWAKASPESLVPAYLLLGKSDLRSDIESPLVKDDESRASAHAMMEKVIMTLVHEINDPAIPFHPTHDQNSNCPTCPYQTICGTLWAKKGRW